MLVKILGVFKVEIITPVHQPAACCWPLLLYTCVLVAARHRRRLTMLCLWAGGGHQTRKRKKYILVMENLFHNRKVPRGLRFDLKGALSLPVALCV